MAQPKQLLKQNSLVKQSQQYNQPQIIQHQSIVKQPMIQTQYNQQPIQPQYNQKMQVNKPIPVKKTVKFIEPTNKRISEPKVLHLEVSDLNNKSSYSYPFNKIDNINCIKLNNYSVPKITFNIEEHKNNTLLLKKNNNEIQVTINKGNYTIETLLEVLNKKLDNIKLSLTLEQNISIESTNGEVFDLLETPLSKFNLGFINKCSNDTNYVSENIWDLRIDNKVYLYIVNLSDTIPFGILFHNGESNSEFKFDQPISLDSMDIVFKDSKGHIYNFYNLSHSLSFSLYTN